MSLDVSDYDKAVADESVCNICNTEMELVRVKPKKNRFDKFHDYYICKICGFRHRKRTYNEILRDINEKE